MSKYYFVLLISITYSLMYIQPGYTQVISDSVFLEQAFQDKNKVAVDSMLNSWHSQSVNRKHGNLENDTIAFVYEVYTRFMKDYIHKEMAGGEGILKDRNYFFVQKKLHFLVIDSLSLKNRYYSLSEISLHDHFPKSYYNLLDYILNAIRNSYKDSAVIMIQPFYADLKDIFSKKNDPKPIYINEDNRRNTLLHFLGYRELTRHFVNVTKNSVEIKKRIIFLNSVLGFDNDKFKSEFSYPFIPEVLNVLVDPKLQYAIVEYYIGPKGGVYLAFYPLKLMNSTSGVPLTWPFYAY